jgi:hypothetical protein
MYGYKTELEIEIIQEKNAIKDLYDRLRIEGLKDLVNIYSQIAAHQQSIAAKRQRIENIGKSMYMNSQAIPKIVNI